jgi:hypothetical protein
MPAYSFKERFVPMVLDGSKPHTIRSRRKKGWAKPGDTLYLYYGLRTKFCRKLRQEKCQDVRTIIIDEAGITIFDRRLSDTELDLTPVDSLQATYKDLTLQEMNDLSWKDGFRPEGSTANNTEGSWELMKRYWSSNNVLPFIGDINYWNPKN